MKRKLISALGLISVMTISLLGSQINGNMIQDSGFELGYPSQGESWTDILNTPISSSSPWIRTTGTCDHWAGGPKDRVGYGDWGGLANGLSAVPDEGGSFVACGSWYPPGERITQHVTGATVGKKYTLSFWYANAGVEGSTTANSWVKAGVWVDNTQIGVTEPLSYLGAGNQVWRKATFIYTATSSEFDFTIGLHSNNDNNNRGYVAFDGAKVKIEKPEAQLIADYHFDECNWDGTTGEVKDSSGNDFNGKATNSANTDTTDGQINGSGKFTRKADGVIVEDITGLDSNNFSVSFWTKIDSGDNVKNELIKLGNVNAKQSVNGDTGVLAIYYSEHLSNLVVMGQRLTGSAYTQMVTSNLKDGKWHHIVVTYIDENMKIYIDSVDKDMIHTNEDGQSGVSNLGILDEFNGVLEIGNNLRERWDTRANIDEVKLYNSALSSAQISKIYNNEKAHKNADGTDREEVVCGIPFSCDDTMYFSNAYDLTSDIKENGYMFLHSINREQSPFTFKKIGDGYHVDGLYSNSYYNALAYNPEDNFLYATVKNRLLKIDKNGIVKDLGIIDGLPNKQHFAGTFGHVESDGRAYYYLTQMHEKQIYKIDVKTRTIKETITMDKAIFTVDMTIDETGNNLYFMQRPIYNADSPNQLMKLNIADKTVTPIGEPVDGESLAGSTFCDDSGRVFVIYDKGGFFEIDTITGERKPISDAPIMANLNDGTMCPSATVKLKPTMTISDAKVIEGGNLVFNISLTNVTNDKRGYTFTYQAFDGNDTNSKLNAQINKDFKAESYGTTLVQELAQDTTITIPTIEDKLAEADENLRLILSDISGVLYFNDIATGTILDDDRPKSGVCYATTDNYTKLFIYDDLNATTGLSSPKELDLTKDGKPIKLDGEGGAYRAVDGYLYQFLDKNDDTVSLQKIDTKSGKVYFVKDINIPHVDAAEFYYDGSSKKEKLYIIYKDKKKLYTINTKNWSIDKTDDLDVYLGSLAINPYTGEAYATVEYSESDHRMDPRKLYKIDLDNGKCTFLFDLPVMDAEGLAFSNEGKLYTDNEIDTGVAEHSIFEIDLKNKMVIPVAKSGTDNGNERFHDIETLSCDAGVYQAPPVFSIEQKEFDVVEGNPSTPNDTNITITIKSSRAVRASDLNPNEKGIFVNVSEGVKPDTVYGDLNWGEIAQWDDIYGSSPNRKAMKVGEDTIVFSQALVKSDLKVESDEHFKCVLTVQNNHATFEDDINYVRVNIIDDDFNTFTAYAGGISGTRKIQTKIVGEEFTLELAKIKDETHYADTTDDTNKTKVKIVDVSMCGKPISDLNQSGFIPFTVSTTGISKNRVNHTFTTAELGNMGLSNKAIKEAKVQFYWEDVKNHTFRSSCSADAFAIRPENYSIDLPQNVIAGEDFNLTVKALDANGDVVSNYEESADVYLYDKNKTQSSCILGKLVENQKRDFKDGKAVVTLNYKEVGDLKFVVKEDRNSSSEYAKIDNNDGSDDIRFIEDSAPKNINFSPFKFFVESNITNSMTSSGYAFYSNTKDKSPIWRIGVTAVNKDENVTKNYNSECVSHDVNITTFIDIDSHVDVNTPLELNYAVDNSDFKSELNITTPSVADKNITFTIGNGSFTDGVADKNITFNFSRKKMVVQEPAMVVFKSVTAVDSNVTGENTPNRSITYKYMRAYIQSPIEVVGSKELNTTVYYEAYDPDSLGNRSVSGDRGWKRVDFDDTSGKMRFENLQVAYGSRVTLTNEGNQTLNVIAIKLPEKNKITMDIDPDFKYVLDHISTDISFTPSSANWAGEGDTGMIIDTNVSRRTKFKRMNW